MDKKRLFSIGKLSKLTGANIPSLRYYETLGILDPAYVDPDSQYRYYTIAQARIVDAIKYCTEMDIPLKEFRSFLSETDGRIDYASLLEYGKKTAQEKMRRIQKRLAFLEEMQRDISHAEACRNRQFLKAEISEKLCWAIPYEGTQTDSTFYSAIYHLISEIERHGLHAGVNSGQLVRYTKEGIHSYVFIDLRETGDVLEGYPQILRIPGGEYLCAVSGESRAKKAPEVFPALFQQDSERTVVEVELFSGQFQYIEPTFELRCKVADRPAAVNP